MDMYVTSKATLPLQARLHVWQAVIGIDINPIHFHMAYQTYHKPTYFVIEMT